MKKYLHLPFEPSGYLKLGMAYFVFHRDVATVDNIDTPTAVGVLLPMQNTLPLEDSSHQWYACIDSNWRQLTHQATFNLPHYNVTVDLQDVEPGLPDRVEAV